MKKFEMPSVEIAEFAVVDVITLSNVLGENETPGTGGFGNY